jgi:hypothetical protein
MAMTAEVEPTRTGWARVAVLRGLIGLVAGIIALFRPDEAAIVLGAALLVVSLLELTVQVNTGDPEADGRRRPLGTAGILLSAGEPSQAMGALLLFTTNFVSIVLAASVVFVIAGVAPIDRLVANAERTQGWMVTFAVAGILLLIPLAIGGQQAFAAATDEQRATAAVEASLGGAPESAIVEVTVSGNAIDVAIAGPGAPPDPAALQAALDAAFGEPVEVTLVVTPTVVFTTPVRVSPSPAPSS